MNERTSGTGPSKFWWDDHAERIAALERIVKALCKELGFDHASLEQLTTRHK